MGFFDFLKVAGQDEIEESVEVSTSRINELREKNIRKNISELDIDGEKIQVAVNGEVATITGSAPTVEDMEKIVLCAGNQHGIGQVDCQIEVDEPPPPPEVSAAPEAAAEASAPKESAPQVAPAPQSVFYTVQPGDSLSKIAAEHYGDAMKYPLIFEANKPMLKDPDKIYPGQSLRIPPL